ncbi:MAG: DUF11 domain-containing protein, partial [Oscillospiraceae bacterium]|nr:DUF11 domain-containing protein [Oscillospiraceae bacterium]
ISSPTPDPNTANNSAIIQTPIASSAADLEITANADRAQTNPSETLTYAITALNYGPSSALAPTVATDELGIIQPEYSLNSLAGGAWQPWAGSVALPDMRPGDSLPILLRGIVPADASGLVTTVVAISSPTPDPNTANNTVIIQTPVTGAGLCAVAFYSDCRLFASLSVPRGEPVCDPGVPCKPGYLFAGWFQHPCARCPWRFDQPVAGDMNLCARWVDCRPRRRCGR